jgi:hypothetical protein
MTTFDGTALDLFRQMARDLGGGAWTHTWQYGWSTVLITAGVIEIRDIAIPAGNAFDTSFHTRAYLSELGRNVIKQLQADGVELFGLPQPAP